MSNGLNRRRFISNTSATAAAILLGKSFMGCASKEEPTSILAKENQPDNFMKEVMKYRKIDTHAHVYFTDDSPKTQLDFADRVGIEKLMISRNLESFSKGTPAEFRNSNDLILRCMKAHPDRFIGMPVLNPTYKKESLDEIQRCVDAGMVGIGELYTHVKINDPLYYPIIEKYIDLKMIVLMHSAIGFSRVVRDEREPLNISLPDEFVEIAKRYPEAMFQFAHIGGGIDWEYACKSLQNLPNVYVDISGSNNEAGMIEFALKYIGEDRLLFACDNAFYQGVGHVLGANLTETQRRKIFFENYNSILKKSGNNVV